MYPFLIFLHVLSIFGFLFAHGVSAAVMFKVRAEHEPARLHALLDLSQALSAAMGLTALLLFVTGLILGFMGQWWARGWIWLSLILFVALSVVMSVLGRPYLERIRAAIGIGTVEQQRQKTPPSPALPPDELAVVLASGRPMLVAAVGLGGLVIITWLMLYKPF
ncbi:MAG: hypothetical protein IT317_10190 [Anaerolineales bacterium]|nr:hypothetical protein [Anaerolineales bacterium]